MKYLGRAALAVLGMVALTTSSTAAVVCNDEGDCWRTADRLDYPPNVGISIYDDDYDIGPKHRWREAGKGRGYYRGGVWIGF